MYVCMDRCMHGSNNVQLAVCLSIHMKKPM